MTTSIAAHPDLNGLKPTPANILEAAIEEFSRASYDSVGMRQIARRAGCASSLIVRHFGTKQNLFRAVLARTFGGFRLDEGESLATSLQRRASADAMTDYAAGTLAIALRSIGNLEAAPIILEFVEDRLMAPMASLIEGPHAVERARAGAAIMIGMQIMRMLYRSDAAAAVQLAGDRLGEVIQFALQDWTVPAEA